MDHVTRCHDTTPGPVARRRRGRRPAGGPLLAALSLCGALALGAVGLDVVTSVPAGASTPVPSPVTWSGTAVPNTNPGIETVDASSITSVTCTSQGYCVAVGYNGTSVDTTVTPVVDVLSTGTWTLVPFGHLTGGTIPSDIVLNQVSCAGPGSCVAVGDSKAEGGLQSPFIATLVKGTWSGQIAPLPATVQGKPTSGGSLASVKCNPTGACVAVGYDSEPGHPNRALLVSGSGTTWSAATPQVPGGIVTVTPVDEYLTAVSCAGADSCVAVGYLVGKTTGQFPLGVVAGGGSPTSTEIPLPADAVKSGKDLKVALPSITCPVAGRCFAVGHYKGTDDQTFPLISTLRGTTWTSVHAPLPSSATVTGDEYAVLKSVSCRGPVTCVAVGGYSNLTGRSFGVIEAQSGTNFGPTQAPLPGGAMTGGSIIATTGLASVSCSAPDYCSAVGTYETFTGTLLATIVTEGRSSWVADTASYPSNALPLDSTPGAGATLDAVSCAAGSCAAGGSDVNDGKDRQGLLDTVNTAPTGYYEVGADGGIFAYTVPFLGSTGGLTLNAPIVGMATDPLTGGYYFVASDGGVFCYTAPFWGSMGAAHLNAPIVGMVMDTRTGGYYLVASDGGIFAFHAPFLGSTGGMTLNAPIVGMAFDQATGGYWLVASDGGIFAYTAPFDGSMGGLPLNQPVVGMAFDPLTGGYYLVASDGGLFCFDAPFHGSTGGLTLNKPVVGMAVDYGTGGYWEVASDGGLFSYSAPFLGSMGGKPLVATVVGMTAA